MDPTSRRGWLAIAMVALAGLGRCAHGRAATEQRAVRGFDAVRWQAVGELEIEQADREQLTIDAEPEVLAQIVTEVRDGRLSIGFAPGRVETRQPIRFRLQVRALRSLEAQGSGRVHLGPLAGASLALRHGGSDGIRIAALHAQALEVRLDGSGSIDIGGGRVDRQRVEIGGSGSYAAFGLASREAEVVIAGSGDARLWVTERLAVRIDGSGDVAYRGAPRVDQRVSGSGSVRKKP